MYTIMLNEISNTIKIYDIKTYVTSVSVTMCYDGMFIDELNMVIIGVERKNCEHGHEDSSFLPN